jgi:glycerol-3-phosphate acyltransferase PlsY
MCSAPATRGAALTFLDALKGTAAVLIGARFGQDTAILGGLGAFLGHLFPVWLGFRGGKGVATYIGVLLGLYWPGAIAFCVTWLLVAAITRYSSLAALGASAVVPCLLLWVGETRIALLFLAFTVLLFWRHADNIGRLMRGEEGRIGAKKT